MLGEFGEVDCTNRKLVLMTPAGSMVPPHELKNIVQQFKGCGCWALKIMFTDSSESLSALALVYDFVCGFKIYVILIFNCFWNFSA